MSCIKGQQDEQRDFPKLMEIPMGFPAVDHPEGNEFSKIRWELGKKLFFDPIMSVDESLSCSSCHLQALSFTDGLEKAVGVEGRIGSRNTPSLANVAYHPYFTREGGVPTLEMQILVPIQEHDEFDFNIVLIAERMLEDSSYVEMSYQAYDRVPDAFVITRALACFERSLLSGYSDFDRFLHYQESTALNNSQKRGMELFFSERTNCSSCHSGFDFSDYSFKNNGLYTEYADDGRFRLTGEEEDRATFKVPSLRNVALTAPYMHDGAFADLHQVIDHYVSGGKMHENKSELIRPLGLSETEKSDLVNFLESLTDEEFAANPLFAK